MNKRVAAKLQNMTTGTCGMDPPSSVVLRIKKIWAVTHLKRGDPSPCLYELFIKNRVFFECFLSVEKRRLTIIFIIICRKKAIFKNIVKKWRKQQLVEFFNYNVSCYILKLKICNSEGDGGLLIRISYRFDFCI